MCCDCNEATYEHRRLYNRQREIAAFAREAKTLAETTPPFKKEVQEANGGNSS